MAKSGSRRIGLEIGLSSVDYWYDGWIVGGVEPREAGLGGRDSISTWTLLLEDREHLQKVYAYLEVLQAPSFLPQFDVRVPDLWLALQDFYFLDPFYQGHERPVPPEHDTLPGEADGHEYDLYAAAGIKFVHL